MKHLVEYVIVTALGLCIIAFVISPAIHKVADSMNASAELIEKAGR